MKLICFRESNIERLGVVSRDGQYILDLSNLNLSSDYKDMIDLIENIKDEDIDKIEKTINNISYDTIKKYNIKDIKICSPLKRTKHDIICIGVNYQDHLEETKANFNNGEFREPRRIVYFSKRVTEAIGHGDYIINDNISEELDYEVELAVIIGKKGKNIIKENVEEYIFGYTIMNDISARDLQQQHLQWYRGKSLDTFTSLGPVIVHKNQMPFPIEVSICSRVNGELRQNSNTKYLIADIPSIIAEISRGLTLEPGDIIATGTPSGVGMGFKPHKYMKSGDIIECEIEKIGVLKNIVL